MDLWPSSGEVVLRIALAALLGAILGLEREWLGKPAGLRSRTLVCIGAATSTLISMDRFARVEETSPAVAGVDPIRIVDGLVDGLVGGVGSLGAGSIVQSRGNVEGLTTASCLWFVGAIGIATGGGHCLIDRGCFCGHRPGRRTRTRDAGAEALPLDSAGCVGRAAGGAVLLQEVQVRATT